MVSHAQSNAGVSVTDYFVFSVFLGLRSIRPWFYREPLARILNPLSYIRGTEFTLVLKEICPVSGDRVLDIGSPKLPFLYLATKSDASLYATDIRNYFVAPVRVFLETLGKRDLIGKRLFLETQDARSLTFPSSSFDKIFSISVLEHIPNDGDSQAMAEIGRTLKPGGVACLTVPYAQRGYSEEFHNADVFERRRNGSEKVFYQRRYDDAALSTRLIEPSGLRVRSVSYFGEPYLYFDRYWVRVPLLWKLPVLWLQPWVEKCLVRVLAPNQLHRAVGVGITLEKTK